MQCGQTNDLLHTGAINLLRYTSFFLKTKKRHRSVDIEIYIKNDGLTGISFITQATKAHIKTIIENNTFRINLL